MMRLFVVVPSAARGRPSIGQEYRVDLEGAAMIQVGYTFWTMVQLSGVMQSDELGVKVASHVSRESDGTCGWSGPP